MSIDIRLPNITAKDEAGQLQQVKSYLHQLVEQLNWALMTIESGSSSSIVDTKGNPVSVATTDKDDPVSTFNSIKALIIKSADIVNAYYEKINARLEGVYVAESDFGKYTERTALDIETNSTAIEQAFYNIQGISSSVEGVENSLIEVKAHINSGLLYYGDNGAPVYGLEIGQRTDVNGEETFNKYARFVANKLSFYDQNNNEVAYISDYKLYITHAEITGSLTLGAFRIPTSRGFTLRYMGKG